jgi:hypothetical protein
VPHLEDQGPNPQTDVEPISGALKIAIGVMAVFVVYILWLIAGGAGDDKNTRIASAPALATAPSPSATPVSPSISAPSTTSKTTEKPAAETPAANVPPAVASDQNLDVPVEVSAIEPLVALSAPVEDADIEIRAARRTWMRIESAEGQVLFSSIIRQGEGFKLESADGYTLATRDAGALEFYVNDKAVGAVGRRGQILTARKIERAAIFAKSR